MLADHVPLGQALGARGQHVVLAERLQHRRAREPRDARGVEGRQHHGGHDEVSEPAHAARGQPAQLHGEEVDQHEAEPEARRGLAERHQHGARMVHRAVAAHRGGDAERHREGERQQHGRPRQQQRGRQSLEHEAERVTPVAQRLSEVAAHGAPHEACVLHEERIVEAQALAVLVDVLGLDVHRHEEQHRVAGQAHHPEHGREREEDDEHGLEQP